MTLNRQGNTYIPCNSHSIFSKFDSNQMRFTLFCNLDLSLFFSVLREHSLVPSSVPGWLGELDADLCQPKQTNTVISPIATLAMAPNYVDGGALSGFFLTSFERRRGVAGDLEEWMREKVTKCKVGRLLLPTRRHSCCDTAEINQRSVNRCCRQWWWSSDESHPTGP